MWVSHPIHPASYHHFMQTHFFEKVNIQPESCHLPDGLARDIPSHCEAHEAAIRLQGGIDLQLLGIGTDGHLGFNEPGPSLASRTSIKRLTERTRQDNRRFFSNEQEVPLHVITMGLATIMDSRICLLLAFGEMKAEAVMRTAGGPVTASVPGSLLQFYPQAKVILDEAAASKLERADYYRRVYERKPSGLADY